MIRKFCFLAVFAATVQSSPAQRHEVGLTLGAIAGRARGTPAGSLDFRAGVALQANYGFRFTGGRTAALLGEVHLLANPLRDVTSVNVLATRDVATLFVVPGVRVKFRPAGQFSPYLAVGGGYALYEHSLNRIDGGPNAAPRNANRGVLGFGGGVDFKIRRFIGCRLEIRDFYTGSPNFNVPVAGRVQHNVVAGGGFVLRFGGRVE